MWISRDDFERLVKDRDDAVRESGRLLTALCAEKEKNEGLSRKCCDYATQIRKEQESTDEALDTLDTIINLTFKGNDCLETVVFQQYGRDPKIYYRGKKVKTQTDSAVHLKFLNGKTKISRKTII